MKNIAQHITEKISIICNNFDYVDLPSSCKPTKLCNNFDYVDLPSSCKPTKLCNNFDYVDLPSSCKPTKLCNNFDYVDLPSSCKPTKLYNNFDYVDLPSSCKGNEMAVLHAQSSQRQHGSLRSFREAPPAHYICRIKPFSSFSKLESFNLPVFKEGGYKWELAIYPNGKKNENGGGYLSVYLVMADVASLPPNWESKTIFRLFLFNHIHGMYLMLEGTKERRFNAVKKEWGWSQFISLKTLRKPTNGYLQDDTCVIGAEVFTIKTTGRLDSLSLVTGSNPSKHSLKINNLSTLKTKWLSKEFTAGGYKWKIELGVASQVSLNLILADLTLLLPGQQVFVDFGLRINNQAHNSNDYVTGQLWFSASKNASGRQKYMSVAKLKDRRNGFVVGDACIVNAKISILGVTNSNRS